MTYSQVFKKSSGGSEKLDAIIDGSVTDITSNAQTIRPYAFFNCNNLITASFPKATYLYNGYNFSGCTSLRSVSLPLVNHVSGNNQFQNCSALTTIDISSLTTLGQGFFNGCSSLETLDLPAITSISGNDCFQFCSSLRTLNLPNLSQVASRMCYGCSSLPLLDFSKATTIKGDYSFGNCSNLNILILRTNAVVSLSNTNAFYNTPFASGGTGGTLYVPQDLISSYESANNWSTILGYANNSIQAIEGSIYE